MHYYGLLKKQSYEIGQKLGCGGDGMVYKIQGFPDLVAKIYRPGRFASDEDRTTMDRKLKAMLSIKIRDRVDGILRLAWPLDILYEDEAMVGFVMTRLHDDSKINHIYHPGFRSKMFPKFTWKHAVQFAYNLSWVVWYAHLNGIVIGDLNSNNICIGQQGEITLIDCDSFDITDSNTGERYPCVVGLQEFLGPELQTVGVLKNGTFTKESDNFSLAIHIFRLLMDGADPFCGRYMGSNQQSQQNVEYNHSIMKGECPYVRSVPDIKELSWAPRMDSLPPEIIGAFSRTFNYTEITAVQNAKNRTTAEEWCKVLLKYAQPEPNPNLKICRVNPDHVYSPHNKRCPWCEREKRLKKRFPGFFGVLQTFFQKKKSLMLSKCKMRLNM